MPIPVSMQNNFRIAGTKDIRSWSYGALTARRHAGATFLDHVRGTLHDQRIFGPVRDYRCACGKFSGERYALMICDRCGVKITTRSSRSTRLGHIDFTSAVQHPLDAETEILCFPVVPADFIESIGGRQLPELYEELIESNQQNDVRHLSQIASAIVELLTPVVVMLHAWNISPACKTLAHGIGLESRV